MKNIIKRILVGVSIGVLLMIIKGNFLTIVHAEENKNNIYYFIPNDEEMSNYNNIIWTNFASDTLDPTLLFTMGSNYFYEYRYKNNPSRLYNYGSIGGYSDYIGESYNVLPGYDGYIDDSYTSIDRIIYYVSSMGSIYNNDYKTHLSIIKNTPYEVLIELEKTNNLTWYANPDNMFQDNNLYNINIVDSSGNLLPQSAIDYKNVEWIPPSGVPGGGNSNLAYIKIRFELSDIVNTKNYYLDTIELYSSKPIATSSSCSTNSDSACGVVSFVFNGSNSTGTLRTKSFSIVENGYISLSSSETDIPGAMPGMDSITQNDLMIKDKYQECATTDIACHLENLQQGLFDIIVRIGNFFTNLIANIRSFFQDLIENIIHIFVPTSDDFDDLEDSISILRNVLHTKLGFLVYPFELLAQIFNTYINLLTDKTFNHTITLPVLKEPFSNTTIWNGGTLDFDSIVGTGAISTLYGVYYAFVSVYIVIMFIDFLYKSLSNFIEGNFFISKKGSEKE